jgi:RNA ligase
MAEHVKFGSIPRLFRPVVITEKIDGTNAAVHVEVVMSPIPATPRGLDVQTEPGDIVDWEHDRVLRVTAQSRTRLITVADDNFGFARWVASHAGPLTETLGEGLHFGEWWGYKIQRGYDLAKDERRFSLFNVKKWAHLDGTQVKGLHVVPVVAEPDLSDDILGISEAANSLRSTGSLAAPGFDNPEGIVVYWPSGSVLFKYTFIGDGHKWEKGQTAGDFDSLPGLARTFRDEEDHG